MGIDLQASEAENIKVRTISVAIETKRPGGMHLSEACMLLHEMKELTRKVFPDGDFTLNYFGKDDNDEKVIVAQLLDLTEIGSEE